MSRRRLTRAFALLGVVTAGVPAAFAQPPQRQPVREVAAVRAAPPPVIDGRLDDPVWAAAVPVGGFLQRDPDEGQPATEETQVRVAFDDRALYVAAEMRDRDPPASCGSCRAATCRSMPTRCSSTSTRTTTT